MRTEDFDYELEDWRIAQHPEEQRDHSKLLIMNRETGQIEHDVFYHLDQYLEEGDVLVMNDTRVLPARLYGYRPDKKESIEVLLLVEKEKDLWECLVRPGKKMKINQKILFGDSQLEGVVVDITEDGSRRIQFQYEGIFQERLEELGTMPLPPYITETLEDQERYQTVYSKVNGSAAAPTAGLHFTDELLERLRHKGVQIAFITLHVGLGTFRPVQVDDVKNHIMHREWYHIGEKTCEMITEAKRRKKKIIAVGTTTMRTLETVSHKYDKKLVSETGWTDIFIYPGFEFYTVDELITNFHLPKSTLLMLISAFSSREQVLHAYEIAKKKDYRFFSFGDAMLMRKD